MSKDILRVMRQSVRGKRQHISIEGKARFTITKAFNAPSASIAAKTFENETAIITIDFEDANSRYVWAGSASDLRRILELGFSAYQNEQAMSREQDAKENT